MKLSLYSSAAWKHPFGLLKLVEWASEYGYDAVGIRGLSFDVPTGLTPRNIRAFGYDMIGPKFLSEKGKRDLVETIESHNLFISEISVYTPLSVPDQNIREECLKIVHEYIDFAVELGAKRLRTIGASGKWALTHNLTGEEAFKLVLNSLKRITSHIENVELPILIETVEGGVLSTAEKCLELIEELNSGLFRVALDPINLYFEQQDINEAIKLLGSHIDIVHSKNAVRTKPTEGTFNIKGYGYKWASISEGDLNWTEILRNLRKVGFNKEVMYEYVNPFKGMGRDYWTEIREPEVWIKENALFMREILSKL